MSRTQTGFNCHMDNPSVPIPSSPWARLKLKPYVRTAAPGGNVNQMQKERLSPLDRLAVAITNKVGSMGFFLIIFSWTVLWCGYNILATEVPRLHLKSFDPFPAFVAYLLISNVIQILLMPLIMVGQNLQSRHSEARAELDFETNQKAEKEVMVVLRHLEHNTDLTIQLMKHLNCQISEEDLLALTAEKDLAEKVIAEKIGPETAPRT